MDNVVCLNKKERSFSDGIFKCHFVNGNLCLLSQTSLEFVASIGSGVGAVLIYITVISLERHGVTSRSTVWLFNILFKLKGKENLPALVDGNPPVTDAVSSKGPVTRKTSPWPGRHITVTS